MLNILALFQDAVSAVPNYGRLGAGIGIGLAVIGAGIGLGRIGGSVAESIARQPEAGSDIRGIGLIIAVLLEGVAIIALVFALLFLFIK